MSIGLDLGSTQFRSLRQNGTRLMGRTCRVCTLEVPDTPAHRRLLDRDHVRYADCGGVLQILGDAAVEWSKLMSLDLRRLLVDGQLPHEDALARQILSLMVDAVLPMSNHPGEICHLTIPGELLPNQPGAEREFFCRLVKLRGYFPQVIGQGHAIVLAELGDAGLSGLGVNLGASSCEFSLNRTGRELARCAIPWGTDELLSLWSQMPAGPLELSGPIAATITDFLVEMLLEAGQRIEQHDGFRVLAQPVAIALAGGLLAQPQLAGALPELFERAWRRAAWPIALQTLKICSDAEYTVARGCLIASVLESEATLPAAAA